MMFVAVFARISHFIFIKCWLNLVFGMMMIGNTVPDDMVNIFQYVHNRHQFLAFNSLWLSDTRARFLSLAWSELRLCSANHRPGYWSNLPCDWPSTAWAYSEQGIENGPRSWSTLAQVMACCLTAPSHHLNKFWFIIKCALWHSPESNFRSELELICNMCWKIVL